MAVNQSMLSNLSEIHRLVDMLDSSVLNLERANIVRLCSNLQYCLADLTESAIPDGFFVYVKPLD